MIRKNEFALKTAGKLMLAVGIALCLLVSGTCASAQQADKNIKDTQSNEISGVFSLILKSLESVVYDSQDKNVTQWIKILQNQSESEDNRINAAERLGETGDNRAAKPLSGILKDKEESDTMRGVAAANLGKVGDTKNTKELIEALDDDYWAVARNAIESLGEIGDKRAVEPLMIVLANANETEQLRAPAALALGKIGDKRAVDLLIENLDDESSMVASDSAVALGLMGDERAIKPLTHALKNENSDVAEDAAEALSELDEPVAGLVIDNLNDRNVQVRKNSVIILGNLKEAEATEKLLGVAKDKAENDEVRINAIYSLGRIGDNSTVVALTEIMENKNEPRSVRSAIPAAFRRIGGNASVEALLNNLDDTDAEVRVSIIEALELISSEESVKPLENVMLTDEKWRARQFAAIALGSIDGNESRQAFAMALSDESAAVRYTAASQLEKFADTSTAEALIKALGNETDQQTRCAMVRALNNTGDTGTLPVLTRIAGDESDYLDVRISAISGLAAFHDNSTVEFLIQILGNKDNSPDLRSAAASALGQSNNTEAIEVLTRVADDDREYIPVRESARQSLEKIQETKVS